MTALAAVAGVAHADSDSRPVTEVVGGVPAPPGKFPWMVRLSMGCGGALTAPRVVLTAGHCVDGTGSTGKIKVIAGSVDLKSPDALVAHSVKVYRAPGFRDETRGDDWAVIRLDHALDVPVLPLSRTDADQGEFIVMGWGQIREDSMKQERRLHYASVPTVSDDKCATEYKKAGVKLVARESICAGSKTADTCQGDSGGPMVGRDAHGDWVQIGIVSWGLGCARDGYPGVYTQVSTFRDDIRAAARKLG
ncbi:serine protease [Actinoplanes sp. NPDC026619]|uniref:S1 family peptidase n=1 Tax=Actinoplanes sp. NPDC026619 TaxID=3155798 RepID=UPI0033C41451